MASSMSRVVGASTVTVGMPRRSRRAPTACALSPRARSGEHVVVELAGEPVARHHAGERRVAPGRQHPLRLSHAAVAHPRHDPLAGRHRQPGDVERPVAVRHLPVDLDEPRTPSRDHLAEHRPARALHQREVARGGAAVGRGRHGGGHDVVGEERVEGRRGDERREELAVDGRGEEAEAASVEREAALQGERRAGRGHGARDAT